MNNTSTQSHLRLSRRGKLLSALLLSSVGASALAQDGNSAEEIIVTSSRIALPLREIGTSVSVMNELQIEAHGNPGLTELLKQMPSVASSSNGGLGKITTVRIRGEEGFRTLTYLDGMRLQDPSAPQITTDFSQLLSNGIGRIEILRGPQGLAFGADAGGVVNLLSRRVDEGFLANVDAQTGEFGTRQLAANVAGDQGRIDYFLSLTDYETDGFNTLKADNVLMDDDGYENTSVHGRLGLQLTDHWRLEAVHRDVDASNEYDGCFDSLTFNTVHQCSNDYGLTASRLGLDYESPAFSHALSFTSTESERQNYSLGQAAFDNVGEQERIEYIGSATALPGFDLVFGADQQEDSADGRSRDNTGVFVEYLSDFSESVYFTAGLRHDDNDDFGKHDSFRLSAAYLLDLSTGTLKFKSAYGTGFRAPSPFEVQYNRSFGTPPAADVMLIQEESKGWEAGVEYFLAALRLEAVYFDQDIENAIFFDLSAFSGYLQDVGTSNSKGVELIAELPLGEAFTVNGNYTYNETERPDGSQRLRRPQNLFNLGLLYKGMDGRLNLNGFYRSQGDALDTTGPLDDFAVLDLTASFQFSDSLRLYGRIENALDEEYEEVLGYNSAGSAAYIGLNFRFAGQ